MCLRVGNAKKTLPSDKMVFNMVFKKCGWTHIGWQAETLAIWQSQQLVVVQHGVKVLHPLWVDITIKDDPLALLQLTSHIVDDPDIQNR